MKKLELRKKPNEGKKSAKGEATAKTRRGLCAGRRFMPLDLVEDQMRLRWVGVALIFCFFAPIIGIFVAGGLETTWDSTDAIQRREAAELESVRLSDAIGQSQNPFEDLALHLAGKCVSEQQCVESKAASCARPCQLLVADRTFLPAAPAANATVATLTDALSQAQLAAQQALDSEGGRMTAIFFYLVLVLLCLFGNSTFHSDAWTYFSCLLSLVLVIVVPLGLPTAHPAFLFWWPTILTVFVSYAVLAAGLLFKRKGKQPPSRISAYLTWDFSRSRRAAYFRYAAQLLSRAEDPATKALRAGLADGSLEEDEVAELEAEREERFEKRYGFRRQIAAILGVPLRRAKRRAGLAVAKAAVGKAAVRKGSFSDMQHDVKVKEAEEETEEEAFFVPVRLSALMLTSLYMHLLLVNTWIRSWQNLSGEIGFFTTRTLVPMQQALVTLAARFKNETGVTMPVSVLDYQLQWAAKHSDSFRIALLAGAAVSVATPPTPPLPPTLTSERSARSWAAFHRRRRCLPNCNCCLG